MVPAMTTVQCSSSGRKPQPIPWTGSAVKAMFWKTWKYIGLNVVLIAASLPLVFRLVPPNRWYGFRLPGTGTSPALWYEINVLGGKMFILSMAICAGVNLLFLWEGLAKARPYLGWINAGLIVLSFWIVSQALVQYLP